MQPGDSGTRTRQKGPLTCGNATVPRGGVESRPSARLLTQANACAHRLSSESFFADHGFSAAFAEGGKVHCPQHESPLSRSG